MRPLIVLALLLTPLLTHAAPQVVATLKPLKLIAQAITEGVSDPHQLLSAGASPHDYQLRPSDIRALQEADLVLWVGPAMEPFLQKPLNQLKDTRVLTLLGGPLTLPHGGEVHGDPSPAHHHGAHEHHDGHDEEAKGAAPLNGHGHPEAGGAVHDHHGNGDPHLWLSPRQGLMIAERLTETLAALDPANSAAYRANLARFSQEVTTVDEALQVRLAPLRQRGYFVFHDGYSHFEQHYGLNHLGAFTLSPQHRPGARQLNEIRALLEDSRAHCVFSEPQFSPRLIEALTAGLPVRQGSLDPLGRDAGSYPEFLQQLGGAFIDCLSR